MLEAQESRELPLSRAQPPTRLLLARPLSQGCPRTRLGLVLLVRPMERLLMRQLPHPWYQLLRENYSRKACKAASE